jgi:hypothetical protein
MYNIRICTLHKEPDAVGARGVSCRRITGMAVTQLCAGLWIRHFGKQFDGTDLNVLHWWINYLCLEQHHRPITSHSGQNQPQC